MNLHEVLDYIAGASAGEIPEILDAVLLRYKAIYPDWNLSVVSTDCKRSKNKQLDETSALLEAMKEK